jgi:hypothetical protein
MSRLRKYLSTSQLISAIHQTFLKIPEPGIKEKRDIKIADCLMSGLAIFGLKWPSLLKYDEERRDTQVKRNLQRLYHVEQAPSDTYLREELDQLDPKKLRPAFKKILADVQRGKALKHYEYWNRHYLIALDGTGQYHSDHVFCQNCCEKHHGDKVSYYHTMLGAVLLHPNRREVIPLAPEPIVKSDGNTKNDCERNAAKRLLSDMRREHPHLKIIITEDGLASNGPHIRLLKDLNMRFILGVKSTDHTFLFDWVSHSAVDTLEKTEPDGTRQVYRWLNGAPLNDAQFDLEINFLEYWEQRPDGQQWHFSWVTDIPLNASTVEVVMKGGRARWKIENETFNTLKNQGYHFGHNFGHGRNQLCSVFTLLMMLAFLVDQVQALCDSLFQKARQRRRTLYSLWETMRVLFDYFELESWESYWKMVAYRSRENSS